MVKVGGFFLCFSFSSRSSFLISPSAGNNMVCDADPKNGRHVAAAGQVRVFIYHISYGHIMGQNLAIWSYYGPTYDACQQTHAYPPTQVYRLVHSGGRRHQGEGSQSDMVQCCGGVQGLFVCVCACLTSNVVVVCKVCMLVCVPVSPRCAGQAGPCPGPGRAGPGHGGQATQPTRHTFGYQVLLIFGSLHILVVT